MSVSTMRGQYWNSVSQKAAAVWKKDVWDLQVCSQHFFELRFSLGNEGKTARAWTPRLGLEVPDVLLPGICAPSSISFSLWFSAMASQLRPSLVVGFERVPIIDIGTIAAPLFADRISDSYNPMQLGSVPRGRPYFKHMIYLSETSCFIVPNEKGWFKHVIYLV